MLQVRKAHERGHARHGWLETQHTFSLADYVDPEHMGFRALRVLNEDRIQPGRGFDAHSHRDMEILTYVVSGALAHQDSLGNGSVIRPGDVQRMSAGTGVTHSEYNASDTDPVHLLQIWILPARRGLPPSYEQRTFPPEERAGRLHLVASGDGGDAAVRIHQDASLYAGLLAPGDVVRHSLLPSRHAWVQVVSGRVEVRGTELTRGDGAALWDETHIDLTAREASEVLLFDLG